VQEKVDDPRTDEKKVVERRREARRAMRAGVALLACSAGVILVAVLIGRASINKYIVALGFILLCLGIGLLVNGAWDWRRWR
jgi:protein-S-isoprenylcysteine O-methyltransferase Ste14